MNPKYILSFALIALLSMPVLAAPKKKATPSLDALFEQADLALVGYDTEALEELLDEIDTQISKNRKATEADKGRQRQLQSSAVTLQNMLGRVEQLVIVDSLCVAVDSVPLVIQLSPESGTLDVVDGAVTYTPALGREVFYTEADENGRLHIMHAGILDDGTRQESQRVPLFESDDVQTAYPFMLPDGATLYFAADAQSDNALGGWDIYMTRRDEQGEFYEPTNVGMPYNSFANDFMMALDENTGLGWWATDRNAPEGMATVYIFKPNSTRVNYSPDSDGIADKAFITNYRDTWPQDFDADAALKPLDNLGNKAGHKGAPDFVFSPGNGKVYTSLTDFRSDRARHLMRKYLEQKRTLVKANQDLDDLRARYAKGDLTLRGKILSSEQRVKQLDANLRTAANAVANAEQKR